MATLEITDGLTFTIPMVSLSGFMLAKGGAPGFIFDASHLRGDIEGSSAVIPDPYRLNMAGFSHDDAATKIQALIRALASAAEYRKSGRWYTPVYIKAQTEFETNPRYSICFGCFELEHPELYGAHFRPEGWIVEKGMTLLRETAWRDRQPGTLPTRLVLATRDGFGGPYSQGHIVSHREDSPVITYIYVHDVSVGFSANLVNSTAFAYFPAAPAVGDILYIGSTTRLPLNIVFDTPGGAAVWTLAVKYSTGAATFGTLTLGTNCGVYPNMQYFLQAAGTNVLSINPPSDVALGTVNGVSAFWVRIEITAYTSGGASAQAYEKVYTVNTPYLEVPALSVKGDTRPLVLLRAYSDGEGTTTPSPQSTSRILVAARSRGLTSFTPVLNAANQLNPAGWGLAGGTDGALQADQRASGLYAYRTSFATNINHVVRFTLTGTSKLPDWLGAFKVFVRARQNGGAAGDVSVSLRIGLGGSGDDVPHYDTLTVKTKTFDKTWEFIDLGRLQTHMAELSPADTFTTADIAVQILASRASGAATIDYDSIWFMPCDEWIAAFKDPLQNTSLGSSALKSFTYLDIDGGVLVDRILKYRIIGTNNIPGEEWLLEGRPPKLRWTDKTQLYFMMLHYPTTWGVGPLLSPLGMHLGVELYVVNRYLVLRGAA
jgi:hypothetical protein